MDDLLYQSALAYQSLMPYRYSFMLGHKMKSSYISIYFPEDAYHHLAGFQYSGIAALQNQKTALQIILAKQITHEHFAKEGFQHEDRWQGICQLQNMIETNELIFHFRGHEKVGSNIIADYVIHNPSSFFFMCENDPVSIFGNTGQNYQKGCPRYVVLKTWRENIATLEKTLVYQSPSFRETPSEL